MKKSPKTSEKSYRPLKTSPRQVKLKFDSQSFEIPDKIKPYFGKVEVIERKTNDYGVSSSNRKTRIVIPNSDLGLKFSYGSQHKNKSVISSA